MAGHAFCLKCETTLPSQFEFKVLKGVSLFLLELEKVIGIFKEGVRYDIEGLGKWLPG
jgi:hypothetical protein